MFLSAYKSIQACQMMEELLGQVMEKLLEAQIHEETKLWSFINLCQNQTRMQGGKNIKVSIWTKALSEE